MLETGGGPAFVVLNDDVPDRAGSGELNMIDAEMRGWMEEMWGDKVRYFSFYVDLMSLNDSSH